MQCHASSLSLFSIPTLALYPSLPLLHKADPGKHYSLIILLLSLSPVSRLSPGTLLTESEFLSLARSRPACLLPLDSRPPAALCRAICFPTASLCAADRGDTHIHWAAALLDLLLLARLSRISCFGPPPGRWFSPVQLLPPYLSHTHTPIRYSDPDPETLLLEHLTHTQPSQH